MLNEELINKTDWTLLSSQFNCYYKKVGKTVEITGTCEPNTELPAYADKIIGTLPTDYRPSHQIVFPIFCYNNDPIYGFVRTNGIVGLFNWQQTKTYRSTELGFNITYLID